MYTKKWSVTGVVVASKRNKQRAKMEFLGRLKVTETLLP